MPKKQQTQQQRQYKISNEGAYVHTSSPLLDGWEKCDSLQTLLTYMTPDSSNVTPGLVWKGPKQKAELLKKLLGTIHEFPNMETAFVICYNAAENELTLLCPSQCGAGARVSFDDSSIELPAGTAVVGTIHTHPEMGAFWSGTDRSDQARRDGLHIVFGLRDGLVSQVLATVFTPHGEYNQRWEDIAEDVDLKTVYPPAPAWVEEIRKQAYKKPEPAVSVNSAYMAHDFQYNTAYYRTPRQKYDWYPGRWDTDTRSTSKVRGRDYDAIEDFYTATDAKRVDFDFDKSPDEDLLRETLAEWWEAGKLDEVKAAIADLEDSEKYSETRNPQVLLWRLDDLLAEITCDGALYEDEALMEDFITVMEDYGFAQVEDTNTEEVKKQSEVQNA